MPAAAFIPLIISAAGTGIESAVQAHAAKSAAKQQQASGQAALGIQKQALSPFMNAGTSSLSRLNSYLTPQGQTPTNIMADPNAMITVVAPNGQTAQRPASEADHWRQLGAQIQTGPATGQAAPRPNLGSQGRPAGGASMSQLMRVQ